MSSSTITLNSITRNNSIEIIETETTTSTYYYYGAGAIAAGILIMYYLCLKLSENSWTSTAPPGPFHLPCIGSLFYTLQKEALDEWITSLLSIYGRICRCCLPNTRLVIAKHDNEFESIIPSSGFKEVTVEEVLFKMINSIGIKIRPTYELVDKCNCLANKFYNYSVSIEDFALLMESVENYRLSLHIKKTEEILNIIFGKKIAFDPFDKDLISSTFKEMENFRTDLIKSSPAGWIHFSFLFPRVYFERKKLHKTLRKVQKKLRELVQKYEEDDEEKFNQLFVIYILMVLAKTSPKKTMRTRKGTSGDLEKSKVSNYKSIQTENTYQPSFDIAGLRFFKALDYVEMFEFVIPPNSFIISYDAQ